ncbi:MAG: hypothetical protein ABJN62_18715 [Halioglobus sp.]
MPSITNAEYEQLQFENRMLKKLLGRGNATGFAGVRPYKTNKGVRYLATVKDLNRKAHSGGTADTAEEAHSLYLKKCAEIYPEKEAG